jgi:serralysin
MPAPDYAIDAIQGPINAKVDIWHVTAAPPLTVTYAFETQQSAEFVRNYTGWTGWTADQKAAVRWALDEYESVVNVRFVEVPAGAGLDPEIAFGRVALDWGGEAFGKYSFQTGAAGDVVSKRRDVGVVWDNERDLTAEAARYILLHEIGHAMLMKHTGDYDVTGISTPGPFLPADEDHGEYSVMSYNRIEGGANAWQLQLYDIAALQARWGENTQTEAGDSVYTFGDDPGIFAIWDTGGVDRIDASAAAGPADINLAEGAFSQFGGQNRMSIAWGAQIENAVGGDSADRLRGNGLENRMTGGAGADTLEGGTGLDFLRGEEGNDSIVGGADFDDAHGNMGDDIVYGGAGDDWVVGGKDQDQLFGDEGADVVLGNLGADTLHGGDGDRDVVRGGQGDDVVYGDAGSDYVSGDRGNDTVFGGGGADVFHGSQDQGVDIVMDFSIAEGDRVMLDPGATYEVRQQGTDIIIDTGAGNLMIVANVELSALPPGWIFESWVF